jgi:hypothetical protein
MKNVENRISEEIPVMFNYQQSMDNTEKTLFLLSKSKEEELSNAEVEELLTDLFFAFKRIQMS